VGEWIDASTQHTPEGKMPKSLKDTIDSWVAGLNPEARKHISIWDRLVLQQHLQVRRHMEEQERLEPEIQQADEAVVDEESTNEPVFERVWLAGRKHDPAPSMKSGKKPENLPRLGRTQRNILKAMRAKTIYKTSEVGALVEVSSSNVSKSLHLLDGAGLVKKVRHGHWRKR